MFFGIDLTSKETKHSACVCLNEKLEVVYDGKIDTNEAILDKIEFYSPIVVAIDSPLNLPSGLCCLSKTCACQPASPSKGRLCERRLAKIGIPCYFTTKRSIIREMVERGIKIKQQLEQKGYEVIEVYPYASKVCLFGKPIPRKSTSEGFVWLREKLSNLFTGCNTKLDNWDHDLCDAAIAAYTGYLYARGDAEPVGNVAEGLIYIPKNSCGRRGNG